MPSLGATLALSLALGLALACAPARAQDGNGDVLFRDLLVLDCTGAVRVAPSHGLAGTVAYSPLVTKAAPFLRQHVLDKARCHCPAASEAEISRAFALDVGNVLWHLDHRDEAAPRSIEECGFTGSFFSIFGNVDESRLEMPPTCNSAVWEKNGTCTFQATTQGNQTLQVAVAQCEAGNPLPFVSVSCVGPLCSSFMLPCQTDADCGDAPGSLRCEAFQGLDTPRFVADIIKGFNASNVYPDDAPCDGKSAFAAATGALESALGVVLGAMNLRGSNEALRFCGAASVPQNRSLDTVIEDYFTPCQLKASLDDPPRDHDWDWDGPSVDRSFHCTPEHGFTEWNGSLGGYLGSALDWQRMNGDAWYPDLQATGTGAQVNGLDRRNARELVSLTCETRLTVMRNTPLEVTAMNGNVHAVLAAMQERVVRPLLECRTEDLTDAQFEVFQNVLSPQFWLKIATTERGNDATPRPDARVVRDALGNVTSGEVANGIVGAFNLLVDGLSRVLPGLHKASGVDPGATRLLDLSPFNGTCSIRQLTETGVCSAKWGLPGKAAGIDAAVTMTLARCDLGAQGDFENAPGASMSAPSLTIGCEGTDCDVLDVWNQAKVCEDDSDCPGSLPCERVSAGVRPLVGNILWKADAPYEYDVPVKYVQLRMAVAPGVDVPFYSNSEVDAFVDRMRRGAGLVPPAGSKKRGLSGGYYYPGGDCATANGTSQNVLQLQANFRTDMGYENIGQKLQEYFEKHANTSLPGVTLVAGQCGNATAPVAVIEDYYDDSDEARSCSATGPLVSDRSNQWYGVGPCFGDSCANRDLFQGDLLAAIYNLTGVPFPAGINRTLAGVCRPKWLDQALRFNWARALDDDLEVGAGLVTYRGVGEFCVGCEVDRLGGRGGPDDDDDDDDDEDYDGDDGEDGLSLGAKLGIAAAGMAVLVAILGACALHKKRRAKASAGSISAVPILDPAADRSVNTRETGYGSTA